MAALRRLVLASASPARRRLLEGAGFAPEVLVSGVDEDDTLGLPPAVLVTVLAEEKAEAAAARPEASGAIVVGCDSMLDVDGQVFGKPASVDEARSRLQRLMGRSAVLRTGHCVIDTKTGRRATEAAATVVRFGRFEDDELEAYLSTGEPLRVAGSFTLDGLSGPFIEGIDGDHGNVIGLSLPLFRKLLREVDVRVTDLWP